MVRTTALSTEMSPLALPIWKGINPPLSLPAVMAYCNVPYAAVS